MSRPIRDSMHATAGPWSEVLYEPQDTGGNGMAITICPVNDDFVAEVCDVDLASPDPGSVEEIKQAFWKYAVLVFPDQKAQPGRACRLRQEFRSDGPQRDQEGGCRPEAARARGHRGRFQSRRQQPGARGEQSAAAPAARQPAVAHRQLVQAGAGAGLPALCPRNSSGRRPDRVRRSARRLRCAVGQAETAGSMA